MNIKNKIRQSLRIFNQINIIFFLFACSNNTVSDGNPELIITASYDLEVVQPSGLTFGKDYQTLWTVSDIPDGGIYEMDLKGNILCSLNFKGDDLEGVSYDHSGDILWVIEEQDKEIIKISPEQGVLNRASILSGSADNHGLEGIAFENSNKLWIANEKTPAKVLLLDSRFLIESEFEPALADDYSGLCMDPDNCILWIVSDESQILVKWSPCDGAYEKYDLPIEKAEGVAVNHRNGQIFIVSDDLQKLFQLKIE